MDAIVLAAGESKKELADLSDDGVVRVNNKPILQIVAEEISKCSFIDNIIVVVKENISYSLPSNAIVRKNSSNSIIGTIKCGIEKVKSLDDYVIFVTSDLPFISNRAIEDFVSRCNDNSVSVYYPIIKKDDIELKYKGTKRTYIKLKEGEFTGGNIFLVKPNMIINNLARIESVYSKRKSPLKLVRILGIFFLIKLLFGRLSLAELEYKCSEILGVNCRTVITPFAEIGVDVDKAIDLEFANEKLAVN